MSKHLVSAFKVICHGKKGYIEIVALSDPDHRGCRTRIGAVAFDSLLEPEYSSRNGRPVAPWLRRFLQRAYHAAIDDICAGRLPFPVKGAAPRPLVQHLSRT